MQFYSLNGKAPSASFKDAVAKGLAPDRGLYFPVKIQKLPDSFFKSISDLSQEEIAFQAIHQFVNPEIPDEILKHIVKETLCFDFPVVNINKHLSSLELFHGPTMAFKDVGARFMSRCLGYFNQNQSKDTTVLVATSGDTGGAVAHGFLGVKGIKVVILYPKGKVSEVQEQQLTTLGQNITALEVDGVFDDCQDMVKQAFLDQTITDHIQITSANSINVARWLPQMFYFFFAYQQLYKKHNNIAFSVPSGNFGNICAGFMAQQLGLPIHHLIAANNRNKVVTDYLKTQRYEPQQTIPTYSNAMDVGNPSNFIRIQEIFKNQFHELKTQLSSYSFSDKDTLKAIDELYHNYHYTVDPHGAIGYLAAKTYQKNNPSTHTVFLETAHPTKFLDVVKKVIKDKIELPEQIKEVMNKDKKMTSISSYKQLKTILLS
ncbi:threonine synthase [Flavobacteriaceae bacterium 14752]|uniref:threonine synthase n=1 Tax=Mesohalobacter salilacus TaxID=2491711 RepID=UPI000F64404A|nr:threonine synthase [Flavobacteriaceae bacterium 14752]